MRPPIPRRGKKLKIIINPKDFARYLLFFVAFLIVANLAVQILKFGFGYEYILGLYNVFDFNTEGNMPTFYSATALLISAALLAVIAREKFVNGDAYRLHWAILSAIFVFLSLDEASSLHETFVIVMQPSLDLQGIFFFAWVIPYGILLVIFAVMYLRFVRALPTRTGRLFIISAAVFLSGAVGMEMAGSATVSALGGWETGFYHLYHVILYSIEEPLEMVGIVIFIYSLLDYLSNEPVESRTVVSVGYDR